VKGMSGIADMISKKKFSETTDGLFAPAVALTEENQKSAPQHDFEVQAREEKYLRGRWAESVGTPPETMPEWLIDAVLKASPPILRFLDAAARLSVASTATGSDDGGPDALGNATPGATLPAARDSSRAFPSIGGGFREIALQMSRFLPAAAAQGPGGLRKALRGPVARAYQQIEAQSSNRIETAASLLAALSAASIPDPSLLGWLVPRIRGYIGAPPDGADRHDWRVAVGGVADCLSEIKLPDVLVRRVAYYHEVLADLHAAWSASRPEGQNPDLRVIEVDCNNIAAALAEWLQQRRLPGGGTVEAVAQPVITRLGRVSVGASLASVSARNRQEALWDNLTMVTRSFGESGWVLVYAEVRGGIARIRLRKRDRAAAGFFNAAVTISRMAENEPASPVPLRWVQVLLNGLGLYWGLALYGPRVAEALVEGDGLDCAVNLHGSLVEVEPELPVALRDAVAFLAPRLKAVIEAAGLASHHDASALLLAWEKLGVVDLESTRPVAPRELDDAVWRVVREALAAEQFAGLALPEPDTPTGRSDWTERLARELLEKLDPGVAKRAEAVAEAAAEAARDPVAAFLSAYADLLKPGPALAAGVVTEDEWKAVVAQSTIETSSLARVLAEVP